MVRQPIYMGGAIIAANKIADIGEQIAENDLDQQTQSTLYSIDQAYWLAVSLKQKQKLAISYRDLVKKLNEDVHKMIQQGVATKADGLKVDVKVNEAEMQITQAEDGLALSKMLLCQLCGIPMNQEITLADEDKETLALSGHSCRHRAAESGSTGFGTEHPARNSACCRMRSTSLKKLPKWFAPSICLTSC